MGLLDLLLYLDDSVMIVVKDTDGNIVKKGSADNLFGFGDEKNNFLVYNISVASDSLVVIIDTESVIIKRSC